MVWKEHNSRCINSPAPARFKRRLQRVHKKGTLIFSRSKIYAACRLLEKHEARRHYDAGLVTRLRGVRPA